MAKNVVITGLGMVTTLGNTPAEILAKMDRPSQAFRIAPFLETSNFPHRLIADILGLNAGEYGLDGKALRIMSRDAVFASVAARLAVRDANLKVDRDYPAHQVALFGATGLSGIAFEEVSQLIRHSSRPNGTFDPRLFGEVALKKILPTLSFKILTNMPICFVSISENIQGMNAIYNPWEGQGGRAIAAGIQAITDGDAECALVGGCEVKTSLLGIIGLFQQDIFSAGSPVDPVIPGEGAAFLVLEEEEAARRRGSRLLARIVSHAVFTLPEGAPPDKRIQSSLDPANLSGSPTRYRKAFLSTEPGKPWAKELFDQTRARSDSVLQPKKVLGDLFAAAAAANLALAAQHVHQNPDGKVLAACFGHGSEKGIFILEPASTQVSPKAPGVGRKRNRVVITGLGIVSPIGNNREAFWKNATQGVSGIGPITLFDASSLTVRIGGEVKDFRTEEIVQKFHPAGRERDRKIFLGLAAATEAMMDAGIQTLADKKATLHVGVSLEVFFLDDVTPIIHAPDLAQAMINTFLTSDAKPRHPLQTPLDRLSDIVGDHYDIRGGRFTICSACAAGAQVVGEAFRLLQSGAADVSLAGAADSMLNPLGMGGFSLLRALSTENDHPKTACRPFDATRQGTVLGEGAAFLVLETLDHAQSRGANIYAELVGYGSSLDAYRVSDPEPGGRGAILSMRKAMADAGVTADQVDAVNAHATGTPKNDVVETSAIKHVLGKRAREIPVHSVKSMTGHLIGASGAVEAAASALTLQRNLIPPTINLRNPDPECDLDYVPDTARPFHGQTILSNSFGFGGQNASLLFKRFGGQKSTREPLGCD